MIELMPFLKSIGKLTLNVGRKELLLFPDMERVRAEGSFVVTGSFQSRCRKVLSVKVQVSPSDGTLCQLGAMPYPTDARPSWEI